MASHIKYLWLIILFLQYRCFYTSSFLRRKFRSGTGFCESRKLSEAKRQERDVPEKRIFINTKVLNAETTTKLQTTDFMEDGVLS